MRREWPQLSWLYKENGVPSLSAERGCAPVLYVIYHILSWIKVLYTDVFLDKMSFFIYTGKRVCYKICENRIFMG